MSRFRGSIDVPLTRSGYCDAVDLGFSFQRVDKIIHDWQQRTIDTARCLQIAHPNAVLEKQHVESQRLGYLEGLEVNKETLLAMQGYVNNPTEVPAPSDNPMSSKDTQCFAEWLREWFFLLDALSAAAVRNKEATIIVTHNRNIHAYSSRKGNDVDRRLFDAEGPGPCGVVRVNDLVHLVRHSSTSWGT